jgi:Sec-independent protein translocase protein TatA
VTERWLIIAVIVVLITGFATLGAQVSRLGARVDQLSTKMDGTSVTSGVRFDEASKKLDGISQQVAAQLKTMETRIAAQISAIAKTGAPSSATPVQPEPVPAPKPAPPPRTRP